MQFGIQKNCGLLPPGHTFLEMLCKNGGFFLLQFIFSPRWATWWVSNLLHMMPRAEMRFFSPNGVVFSSHASNFRFSTFSTWRHVLCVQFPPRVSTGCHFLRVEPHIWASFIIHVATCYRSRSVVPAIREAVRLSQGGTKKVEQGHVVHQIIHMI